MNAFNQYAPTEVIFGKDTEKQVGEAAKKWGGSRVLIVYGGGSVVRSGLLDRVKASLDEAGIIWQEFGGARPNPYLDHAREGVQKAIAFGADLILAVGGGSTIDTAKGIAHGTANPDTDLWDIWKKKVPLTKSLPVGVVLTIAAAGSEMSDSAVLTNVETGEKAGLGTDYNRAKFAIMNPELTFTLPDYQIACGVTDIMMHTMERYFLPNSHAMLTDEMAEGLLRTVIANGRIAMKDKTDYNAMAEIMWCSSISHNGLTGCGRPARDFSVHKFGHALTVRYDAAHGATLSAVWKAWAEWACEGEGAMERFARFARKVWLVEEEDDRAAAMEGIRRTVAYFKEIGVATCLKDLGADPTEEDLEELAMKTTANDTMKICPARLIGAAEAKEIFRAAK